MTFKELQIVEPILKALQEKGYTQPTPIQEQAIPILLKEKDLMGCAQTGTGKTAAFTIPILQHLYNRLDHAKGKRKIKALIVTPTRELALQIGDNIKLYSKYTGLNSTVIFGGVKQGSQTSALAKGVDVLVATPGRLLDLMNQGFISLRSIKYFVLDEADQMLDMGFIHDIKKLIAQLPPQRQSLFFSATMPMAIKDLSSKILGDYELITIKPEQATAERVDQTLYYVSKQNKTKLLIHLLKKDSIDSVLVFSRTKHGADKIVKGLAKENIKAEAIHGNKSQNARVKALGNFKSGITKVLVATDIAARGIDVSGLKLVVQYDLPNIPETYVHRIGRTGRAKASGDAVSFCAGDERPYLKSIQKLIGQTIPLIEDQPFPCDGTVTESSIPVQRPRTFNRNKEKQAGGRGGQGQNKSGGGNSSRPKFRPKKRD